MPLEFVNETDYDSIDLMDELELADIRSIIDNGGTVKVTNKTKGTSFEVSCELSRRQRDIILAGGLLNYTRENV